MEKYKACSFFGHRKIAVTDCLTHELEEIIEDLILKGVSVFLFGSNSEFDSLCHSIVTSLKTKYPNIKRVSYTCKSESCTLEENREQMEKLFSSVLKRNISIQGYEEEFEHKTKYTSGRASYIERNQAMINDSDYCIFYYNENYAPEMRKYSKRSPIYYQPKSGTRIAFEYANQKKKIIINMAKN